MLGVEFEQRNVRKRYRAIVVGNVKNNKGICSTSIDGKKATTEWVVVSRTKSLHSDWITTMDLFPKTGRKHQLRIHCASEMGHPIVGDKMYTKNKKVLCHHKGLFLRALELTFSNVFHHETGKCLHVEIPEPHKFQMYRSKEEARYNKHRVDESNGMEKKISQEEVQEEEVKKYQKEEEEQDEQARINAAALEQDLDMAHEFEDEGRLADAEALYRKILKARTLSLGYDNPETATIAWNLGIVLQDQNMLEDAEPLLLRTLESYEKMLEKNCPDTLVVAYGLADFFDTKGDFERAELYSRQSLNGFMELRSAEDVVDGVEQLCDLLEKQGKTEEVEAIVAKFQIE